MPGDEWRGEVEAADLEERGDHSRAIAESLATQSELVEDVAAALVRQGSKRSLEA